MRGAWLEVSTGELWIARSEQVEELLAMASALNPREILIREGARDEWRESSSGWLASFELLSTRRLTSELPPSHFDGPSGERLLLEVLGVANLDGFAIAPHHPALGPAGALLRYAARNLCGKVGNVHRIREMRFDRALLLDSTTVANLEIFRSVRGTREGSLLHAIDRTVTAPGARLLEEFLTQPLLSLDEIRRRQEIVGEFVGAIRLSGELRTSLRRTRDLLRMLGRLQNRLRLPREAGGILSTLEILPAILEILDRMGGEKIRALAAAIGDFYGLRTWLGGALADNLPADTSEGGFIRDGFDEKLDHYRSVLSSGERWIREFEAGEQAATGIRSLRVRNNGTFGYFIEVTRANLRSVPEHYRRRQTMVNGERYTTEELRQKELEIFEAQRNALSWEQEIFEGVVGKILENAAELAKAAHCLAELDVLSSWAQLAVEEKYVCPELELSTLLEIHGGRHPVVEQVLSQAGSECFIPNDTRMDGSDAQIALITGPNMGGKSTYVRQVALIVLLAQMGCWVPATGARIGCVDRIFSRIGAGDDLSRGQSTFMVEMGETAAILHAATHSSLILLDEIGRGTSTYDGLSIAWAVLEYLHGDASSGPRTLFTTHFHEMTRLADRLPRVRNFSVAVRESGDEILFLRKIIPGAADRSYGIHVAKLAGLPPQVIERAQAILGNLESGRTGLDAMPR
jgi:DNA mismatch repair protein MutS